MRITHDRAFSICDTQYPERFAAKVGNIAFAVEQGALIVTRLGFTEVAPGFHVATSEEVARIADARLFDRRAARRALRTAARVLCK